MMRNGPECVSHGTHLPLGNKMQFVSAFVVNMHSKVIYTFRDELEALLLKQINVCSQ